jgi:hypothetical protein
VTVTLILRHTGFTSSGRGTLLDTTRAPIERYTEEQLTHFISSTQSPHITTDMPFGERKLQLSSGEQSVVPDIIRNMTPTRIVSHKGTYLSVSTRKEISIIVSRRVTHGYLIYKYLSCPSLDMKEKKPQLFQFSTSFDSDIF